MSLLSEKLSKKILQDTGVRTDPGTFRRTYAGYWQRAAGAFLWTMKAKDGAITVGSCDRASDCIKADVRLFACDVGFCVIEIIADESAPDAAQVGNEGRERKINFLPNLLELYIDSSPRSH